MEDDNATWMYVNQYVGDNFDWTLFEPVATVNVSTNNEVALGLDSFYILCIKAKPREAEIFFIRGRIFLQ